VTKPDAPMLGTPRPAPRPGRGGPWERYVAVGDSFSEGMSDDHPTRTGTYAGWADRLAAFLAAEAHAAGHVFGYANLAVRGRLLADIAGRQVDEALALSPDLVSIVGGGNDLLRPKADVDALAARLEVAVARLRAAGADVLMATPVDPREAPVVRRIRGRSAVYTAAIWSIAARHGAYVIDQWGMTALRDSRLWASDRIHMTAEGHRRVALNALTTLGRGPAAGRNPEWATPLPPVQRPSRRDAVRADARWAREYFGPWVQRRLQGRSSGDGLSAKRPSVTPFER